MGIYDESTFDIDWQWHYDMLDSEEPLSQKEKRDIIRDIYELEIDTEFGLLARKIYDSLPTIIPTDIVKRRPILKKTGERYVGHCIELWLWEKGYALNGLGENSFSIHPQYIQGNHRIDFKVEITTANKNISLIIDAKNWARYDRAELLSYLPGHIIPYHSFTGNYKLMFLNERLILNAIKLLQKSNIEPIRVDEHLTDKQYIERYIVLVTSMKNSIKDLDKLLSIPDVSKGISKLKTSDVIKYDIELGKPYKLLQEKWEIERSYIDNLRNQMIRAGVNLPRRNTHQFTGLCRYNDYFKRS